MAYMLSKELVAEVVCVELVQNDHLSLTDMQLTFVSISTRFRTLSETSGIVVTC